MSVVVHEPEQMHFLHGPYGSCRHAPSSSLYTAACSAAGDTLGDVDIAEPASDVTGEYAGDPENDGEPEKDGEPENEGEK